MLHVLGILPDILFDSNYFYLIKSGCIQYVIGISVLEIFSNLITILSHIKSTFWNRPNKCLDEHFQRSVSAVQAQKIEFWRRLITVDETWFTIIRPK